MRFELIPSDPRYSRHVRVDPFTMKGYMKRRLLDFSRLFHHEM